MCALVFFDCCREEITTIEMGNRKRLATIFKVADKRIASVVAKKETETRGNDEIVEQSKAS